MYIENINGPEDVKKLTIDQLPTLAEEIRHALLLRASRHMGHFGPNFGMVEATIALHYVFDSPKDKIVYDVSHQSYPHKMLTGRKDAFLYEEHYDDVSGYSNPHESEHDFFTVGHTSTSISLACGLAKGRDLKGEKGNVIAVIGDGSLSGGEALEGLDFASELQSNLIILVNDNDMSIAENHGGLYANLKLLRETNGTADCNLFKAMNLGYVYVNEGNNVSALIEAFQKVKDTTKPVVVHINTLKGKGYAPAEQNKEEWHYHAPFDIKTGQSLVTSDAPDYSSVTCEYLLDKMKKDPKVVAITAGTPTVMGFTKDKRDLAGSQFVDVGIAEETAAALASGIAANGGKPVFGVYSTFVQRTFDQVSQDICINNSPATIVTFQGSVYGMNDVTHLGFQDIPMLSNIPNLVYLAPTTKEEYLSMLDWSIEQNEHPVAIKLPGKEMISDGKTITNDWSRLNTYEVTEKGSKVAILGLGTFYGLGEEVCEKLKEAGVNATLINPHYISGLDETLLQSLKEEHSVVVTLEDGILDGGFGEKIARFYGSDDVKVLNYGLKKEFLDRYDVAAVLKANRLTREQIAEDIQKLL
ncbi:1-deoxy-D-xylulose-5-phosphate synthase [Roseburia sp. MUC/MUC-530-WT-4D]|uniref:1-deoxy-D-xylulose-5-phosphate synthase n=1 Tax=Roseburia porci TaxID=2605790 RepID=A0A6L5YTW6_9FIRM|nr:1-deoxy-D-xylulose-5-phosphate synthase [Roseburia porci]MCI5517447.1 1-deoxy-D-xylulose-5-phosphate synthase [Roseburia sp.]MDD6742731.1 1-deoxy-D-xylulose-5-phosphate synthase [Roseburia porci]MST75844.1 1-deoxy-D-xylulose-5-phosphate synthase [Roseburia porci]